MKPRNLNRQGTLTLLSRVWSKAESRRDFVDGLRRDVVRLGRLAQAWAEGRYTAVPWRTLGLATGALIYFVNPFDAVPDVLVGVGYLDDATVLAFVAGSLRGDLDRFEQWQQAATDADAIVQQPERY